MTGRQRYHFDVTTDVEFHSNGKFTILKQWLEETYGLVPKIKEEPIEKILTCPFCGYEHCDIDYESWMEEEIPKFLYFVWCPECDASGPTSNIKNEAIFKWNQFNIKRFEQDTSNIDNICGKLQQIQVNNTLKKIRSIKEEYGNNKSRT